MEEIGFESSTLGAILWLKYFFVCYTFILITFKFLTCCVFSRLKENMHKDIIAFSRRPFSPPRYFCKFPFLNFYAVMLLRYPLASLQTY